jgi:hypothetical protein
MTFLHRNMSRRARTKRVLALDVAGIHVFLLF